MLVKRFTSQRKYNHVTSDLTNIHAQHSVYTDCGISDQIQTFHLQKCNYNSNQLRYTQF